MLGIFFLLGAPVCATTPPTPSPLCFLLGGQELNWLEPAANSDQVNIASQCLMVTQGERERERERDGRKARRQEERSERERERESFYARIKV